MTEEEKKKLAEELVKLPYDYEKNYQGRRYVILSDVFNLLGINYDDYV